MHLPVDASENQVHTAGDGHRVGDPVAAHELGQDLQVDEARVTELEPVRVA